MKTRTHFLILLTIAVYLLTSLGHAKTPVARHLTYKGIPLTGTLKHFQNELETKGFIATEITEDDTPSETFKGKFAGYNVLLQVMSTPLTTTVYGTLSFLENHNEWHEIQNDYTVFKKNLVEMYGQPTFNREEMLQPYTQNDGYSMKALDERKIIYVAEWQLENGTIRLSVQQKKKRTGFVLIEYTDSVNEKLKDEEEKRIINNDL